MLYLKQLKQIKPCDHPCPWQGKEICRNCSNNMNGGKQ